MLENHVTVQKCSDAELMQLSSDIRQHGGSVADAFDQVLKQQ